MSAPGGWDRKSIRNHVESAQSTADEAVGLAQTATDELEEVSKVADESSDLAETNRIEIEALKAEFNKIDPLLRRRPGMIITQYQARLMTHNDIAEQAEMMGALVYEALSEWCIKSVGDEDAQRDYVNDIGYGLRGFLKSFAMQVRGSLAPETGDE